MIENMTITDYGESGVIYFGDTVFENGVFNMASTGTIKRGCLLARDVSGKFKKFTGSDDVPVAIYCGDDVKFATSVDLPIRVLIAGKVNSSKILVNESEATAVQKDLAKANGIIPVPMTEIGLKDNH